MPDKPDEFIELFVGPDGVVVLPWWTKEAHEICKQVGPPAKGYETVNQNPWCG